jgi:hypothetical protein
VALRSSSVLAFSASSDKSLNAGLQVIDGGDIFFKRLISRSLRLPTILVIRALSMEIPWPD